MQRLFSITVVIFAVFTFANADFKNDALDLHNQYRSKHHAAPLTLSNELNNVAQNWAQKMARSNNMKHNPSNKKYGENVYMTSNTKMSDSEAAIDATTQWYNEYSKYNFGIGRFTSNTGHFTQVVWKSSKYLGIGVARSNRGIYVCANYDPRGNMGNEFIQNVLRP